MQIQLRKEAIELKLKHYFTGKACKNGHIAKRLVSTKQCLDCEKERSALRRREDPSFVEANQKHSAKFNKENREYLCQRKRTRYATEEEFRKSEKCRAQEYYRTEAGLQSKIKSRSRYRALKINTETQCVNINLTEQFYLECPKGYEVDHIIPLSKGGNHDISNLQYLTKALNVSKKDRHYTEIDLPIYCIPCNPII